MAAVVIVPVEETEALDRAIAGWTEEIGPENVAEESLVQQMAAADVRMRRCARVNETAMEGDAVEAVRRWEAKRRHRVRHKAQDLKNDPVNVVEELEASSFGCEWLIRRWRHLESGLRLGLGWPQPHLEEALRLLGYAQVIAPTGAGDPEAIRLWTLALRSSPGGIKAGEHFRPDPEVPEAWAEAMALLRQFIAAQIERLAVLRDEAWEAVDGPEAEAVAAKALMDAGKEAQVRHRYYRDAQLGQHRALRQLAAIREHRRKAEAEAPRGVTGAAILEAICVQEVARARAEAAAHDAPAPRRTEPNAAAHRDGIHPHKTISGNELGRERIGPDPASERRTEPRFPGVGEPPKGLEPGWQGGSTGPRTPGGAS